jgi:cyclase
MSKLIFSFLLAISVLVLGLVSAQQRPTLTPEQVEHIQIRPVADKPGLYVIPGFDGNMSGGNVTVRVTGEGVILVDDKFVDSHAFIMEQVRKVTAEPVRYVLNTHHHFDHTGSNADFMPAAQVIGHENARINLLRAGQTGAPPLTFATRTTVFLGNAEVQAHYFGRGHTDGDSLIYFPDLRTVHTGDLILWGDRMDGTTLSPFIDYANGGSAIAWTATLDGLLSLDFDTVIPGHGPILNKDDVRLFREKFASLQQRMSQLIESGVTREAIVTELNTEDLNWPLVPDRIQAIYDEMSK